MKSTLVEFARFKNLGTGVLRQGDDYLRTVADLPVQPCEMPIDQRPFNKLMRELRYRTASEQERQEALQRVSELSTDLLGLRPGGGDGTRNLASILEEGADSLFVGLQWDDPTLQPPATLAATELVFLTQIARIGTRETIYPVRVESPYPMQPEEAYETYFGVAPHRGEKHGVTFSAVDAKRPFLTASETLWQTFEPELRRRLTQLDTSAPLEERVRQILLEGLPSGESSIDVTARRLGQSPRTLQRGLKSEGTSYKEVVRRTREQLARHYVTSTKLGYTEIGFLIGYEEPSSFFRAFREWTGQTPESIRLAFSG